VLRTGHGTVLWIHKSLVTTRYRCAVVGTDEVNIRTGPGTRYGKRFSDAAKKYYSAKILKVKGSWVRVVDPDGDIGWIRKDYVWIR
jgi:SH3-like domain-containing protein